MPMFLQVARGSSPTASGLEMMPMMIGMLGASIASGQWISRTGRYKLFPVVGMGLVVAALTLLARLTADITLPALIVRLLLLGVGLGLVMQVLVLAVQNAVPYADLGAATSSAMLFRLVGGAMGTAVLGVIFASSLHPGAGSATQAEAITGAMRNVFTAAAVVAAVGAILTWFLPERPLRDTVAATAGVVGYESGEAFAMTARDDSQDALVRGLSILAARDVRRAFIQGVVDRAGVQLMPISAWLLIRLGEDAGADLVTLAAERGVTRQRVDEGITELRARGFVAGAANTVTPEGCDAFGRLSAARQSRLAELSAQWPREQREEIAAVLRSLARALVPDAPAKRG